MENFKLYGIYVPSLESWVREIGAKIKAEANNPNVILTELYFDFEHPLSIKHGWDRTPMFVAVKHNQPFTKIIGKHGWSTYEDWMHSVSWKI